MKKKMADMVFKDINPPDYKPVLSSTDLAEILVQRLGLQRKVSRARHAELLKHLLKLKRTNTPTTIEDMAKVLKVSVSQSYEEIRKWRTLGILEFVRVPVEGTNEYLKGYMLSSITVNQAIDRVQSSVNAFMRRTRRIAKDFDDQVSAEVARAARTKPAAKEQPSE